MTVMKLQTAIKGDLLADSEPTLNMLPLFLLLLLIVKLGGKI